MIWYTFEREKWSPPQHLGDWLLVAAFGVGSIFQFLRAGSFLVAGDLGIAAMALVSGAWCGLLCITGAAETLEKMSRL